MELRLYDKNLYMSKRERAEKVERLQEFIANERDQDVKEALQRMLDALLPKKGVPHA